MGFLSHFSCDCKKVEKTFTFDISLINYFVYNFNCDANNQCEILRNRVKNMIFHMIHCLRTLVEIAKKHEEGNGTEDLTLVCLLTYLDTPKLSL